MGDDDANYVMSRTVTNGSIEGGNREQIRGEAETIEECIFMFDHASTD